MTRWQVADWGGKLNGECELRAHENRSLQIQFINGQLVGNRRSSSGGLSARHYHAGAWGFASVPEISAGAADRVLSFSKTNATTLAKRVKDEHFRFAPRNAHIEINHATKKPRYASQDLLAKLNQYDVYIANKYKDLKSRTLAVMEQEFEKELIATGSACYSLLARSYLYITLGMDSPNGPVELRHIFGHIGQLEDTLPSMDEFAEGVEEAYKAI